MLDNGFIKIYRSLLKWEWYDDINTKTVFLHLLLTVSIEDSKWHGIDVKRGSRVASFEVLAKETKLTIRQLRTAINHLETTGEVTRQKHPTFTVFSVKNFDKFQTVTNDVTSDRQGNDKAPTRERQQYKKIKEDKKKIKEYIEFGEYRRVKLTQEQYDNLVSDYSKSVVESYIKKMDEWIQLKGKSPYKDYNLAIRNWLNRDGVKKGERYAADSAVYDGFI